MGVGASMRKCRSRGDERRRSGSMIRIRLRARVRVGDVRFGYCSLVSEDRSTSPAGPAYTRADVSAHEQFGRGHWSVKSVKKRRFFFQSRPSCRIRTVIWMADALVWSAVKNAITDDDCKIDRLDRLAGVISDR